MRSAFPLRRHLQAAEGYLELGLPGEATAEMIALAQAGLGSDDPALLWANTLEAGRKHHDALAVKDSLTPTPHSLPLLGRVRCYFLLGFVSEIRSIEALQQLALRAGRRARKDTKK